jgi:hypothetical protein
MAGGNGLETALGNLVKRDDWIFACCRFLVGVVCNVDLPLVESACNTSRYTVRDYVIRGGKGEEGRPAWMAWMAWMTIPVLL